MTPHYAELAIDVLGKVRGYITDGSDMLWSSYDSPEELRGVIDGIVSGLRGGDMAKMEEANLEFLPTSSFQEHSMQNGWSEVYLMLAEQFDALYEQYKNS